MTKVIHIRDQQHTPDEVYIGRGSLWGNPFKIGRDGDRDEVIAEYWGLMDTRLKAKPQYWHDELQKLRGKTLVCYCKPQACHGDVLVEMLGE